MHFNTDMVWVTLVIVQATGLNKVKWNLHVNTQLLINQDNEISVWLSVQYNMQQNNTTILQKKKRQYLLTVQYWVTTIHVILHK
jgi:hypothetical protein